jgi:Mg2+ and Co2+ transporter CorA
MTRRVNYEDNIFYLSLILKGVTASLKLNIDTDLYRDKILDDIRFLDKTASSIHQSLKANHLMIDRLAHLKSLQKMNAAFIALLEDILEERLPLASALEQDFDLLQRIQSTREAELAGLQEMSWKLGERAEDQEQIVSEKEFKFLLSSEEEQQKPSD